MLKAAICTIGDEILIGQIVDTNSSVIARELNKAGVKITKMLSISDEQEDVYSSLTKALQDNDIVITTGGLGPTKDDITKIVLARLFKSGKMLINEEQLVVIHDIFRKRGIPVSDLNRAQAEIPAGCEVIINQLGTAPGMIFRFKDESFLHKPVLYSLPGVPYETIAMLPQVVENITKNSVRDNIYHKTLVTFGVPESELAIRLSEWEDRLPEDIKLAYLPNPSIGIRLRLSKYGGENRSESQEKIEKYAYQLRDLLSDCVYGEEEDTLEKVVGKLLINSRAKVSIAESCTGGRIASMITSVPGSSQWFDGSVTAYQNDIKRDLLNVSSETLERYGAVSGECVIEMALGVKQLMNSEFSLATSGIAGPSGGSEERPVGLVWIAVAYNDLTSKDERVEVVSFVFSGDRERNMDRFASNALNFLRKIIINNS